MSSRHQLEDLMDAEFPPDVPYFDLEAADAVVAGELECPCGVISWISYAVAGEPLTCAACHQSYLVGTRLHLLPIAR